MLGGDPLAEPRRLPEGLGAALEGREEVRVALEEVGDLVVGGIVEAQRPLGLVLLALGDGVEHVVELRAGVLVEIEERGDGGDHLRLGAQPLQVVLAEIEAPQQRLVEELGQLVVHRRLAEALHESLHRDVVELEGLEEQGQLNRALPLLDQAQIGGGDLEAPRDLALLQPPPQTQLTEPPAHGGVALGAVFRAAGGGHRVLPLYRSPPIRARRL